MIANRASEPPAPVADFPDDCICLSQLDWVITLAIKMKIRNLLNRDIKESLVLMELVWLFPWYYG